MEAFARVYAAVEAFPAPDGRACAWATSSARAPSSPPAATCASAATTSSSRGPARGSACRSGPARLAPLVGLARGQGARVHRAHARHGARRARSGCCTARRPPPSAEAAAIALAARARRPPARGAAPAEGDVPRARRAPPRTSRARTSCSSSGSARAPGCRTAGCEAPDDARRRLPWSACASCASRCPRRASASATASRASSSARRRPS